MMYGLFPDIRKKEVMDYYTDQYIAKQKMLRYEWDIPHMATTLSRLITWEETPTEKITKEAMKLSIPNQVDLCVTLLEMVALQEIEKKEEDSNL